MIAPFPDIFPVRIVGLYNQSHLQPPFDYLHDYLHGMICLGKNRDSVRFDSTLGEEFVEEEPQRVSTRQGRGIEQGQCPQGKEIRSPRVAMLKVNCVEYIGLSDAGLGPADRHGFTGSDT